jgi:hypothetical protein
MGLLGSAGTVCTAHEVTQDGGVDDTGRRRRDERGLRGMRRSHRGPRAPFSNGMNSLPRCYQDGMNSLPEGYETQINSSTTRRSRPTDGRSISCEFGWCCTEPGACGSSTLAPASETLDPAPAGTASYSGWKPPTQAPERPDRSGRSCKGRRHPSAPRSFPPGRLIDRRILPVWPRSAPRRSRMRLLSAGSMSACGRSPMACRCVRLAGRCPTSTWMGCGPRNGQRAGSAA